MKNEENSERWFTNIKPRVDAEMRLFCFPFSGGGASVYRSWPDAMSDKIDVHAVQLPGRETRYNELRVTDIKALVKDIASAFVSMQDKPFAFFGYSLGALLAFEVYRELCAQNMNLPGHLFVAAMRAPQTPKVHEPLSSLADEVFLQKIEHYYQPQDEAWNNLELREIFLPILKDDLALSDGYSYTEGSPLQCPIDVFAGKDDRGAPLALTQLWSEQSNAEVNHHVFSGSHFFINTALADIQSIVLTTMKLSL